MPKPRAPRPRHKARVRRSSAPSPAALRAMVRPIVKELMAKELGPLKDRLDCMESEASLADGKPIPAGTVWKELGL